jgi:hypothetical protein
MKKMKRIQILMLLITLSPLHFVMAQQIVYVDISNNSGIEDGSQQHPYNTIEEGIEVATAGTTLMISAGNYLPDSTWNQYNNALYIKPGISLLGAGMANTIIQGVIVDWNVGNLSCTLEGISFLEYHFVRGPSTGPFNQPNVIRNCHADKIEISHSAGIPVGGNPGPIYNFMIENNDLGTDGRIEFRQGSGNVENTVQNNDCGYIYILSGAGYTYQIDSNDIQYGIVDASGVCNTTISNNRIFNGAIIDKSGGQQNGTEDQFIEFNHITCNQNAPILAEEEVNAAISATPQSVTIRNNIITCSGSVSGVSAVSGSPFHLLNNTITVDEFTQPLPDTAEGVCAVYSKSGWGYVRGNIIHGGYIGYYSKAGTEDFSGNEIIGAYTGFFSSGAEEVHHNTIKECHGDGMILNGLRGPIHNNIIKNNAGEGIRIIKSNIDLGGGADNGPGLNYITGNGDYDLYVQCTSQQNPTIYARHNVWDHSDSADIMQYDIRDGSDSTDLVAIDFQPIGYAGIDDLGTSDQISMLPNPTTGRIHITFSQNQIQIASFAITDLYGKKLMFVKPETVKKDMNLDISQLPAGMYFINIESERNVVIKKIIKL